MMIFASHLFQPLQAVADLYLCHAGLRRAGALGFVRCDWRTLPGAGRHLELIIGKLGEGWCQGFSSTRRPGFAANLDVI